MSELLNAGFAELKAGFRKQPAPTLSQRRAWLDALRTMLLDNKQRFCDAIAEDFGTRTEIETLGAEVLVADGSIKYLRSHLPKLMAIEERHISLLFAPARGEVRYQPKGVVGVMSPWNYPLQLALVPIATALAAGNRVLLKPSELTPKTSALLEELLHATFPSDLVRVVCGDARVGAAFSKLKFDHILFTGSTAVGALVMQEAAKNLVPVTLELGGKSPAIVHRKANLGLAAERIVFGKCLNAGQTCIAVDYVLVPRELETEFVAKLTAQLERFFGGDVAKNEDYSSIINDRHKARIEGLVSDAENQGAKVTRYGPVGACEGTGKIAPTLIQNLTDDMTVMKEEIFGPVLPIVVYDALEDAIAYVNERPRPLALYYFDTHGGRIDQVLNATHAGGVCINDTMLHVAQDDLPFGGIGPSGLGAYHGREGFIALSHAKAVFHQRRIRFTTLFNPPYGRGVRAFLRAVVGR